MYNDVPKLTLIIAMVGDDADGDVNGLGDVADADDHFEVDPVEDDRTRDRK